MKTFKFIWVVIGLCTSVYAQQLPSSNLYTTDRYRINSAFAGETDCIQGYLGHFSQFNGVNGSPETSYLAVHSPVLKSMGIGAKILFDNTPIIDKTSFTGSYAYGLKIGTDHKLRFGLSLGFYQVKLSFTDAVVADLTDNVIAGGTQSSFTFNNDFSVYYTHKNLYAGISVPQIVESSASYDIGSSDAAFVLERHYIGIVGTNVTLDKTWSIQPSLLYKAVEFDNSQIDVNAQASYKDLLFGGLGYRTGGSILFRFGINFRNMYNLSYAYESAAGDNIVGISNGSHEIVLGIRLCKNAPSIKEINVAKQKEKQKVIAEAIQDSLIDSQNKEYLRVMEEGDSILFNQADLETARTFYVKATALDPARSEPRDRIKYIDQEIERQSIVQDLSNRDNLLIHDQGQDAYVVARGAADLAESAARAARKAAKVASKAATAAVEAAAATKEVDSESARMATEAAKKAAKESEKAAQIATEAAQDATNSASESSLAASTIKESVAPEATTIAVAKALKASESALQAATIATAASAEATNAAKAVQSVAKSANEVADAGVKEENAIRARKAAEKAVEKAKLTAQIVKDIRAKIEYLKENPYDVSQGKSFESKRETPKQRRERLLSIVSKEHLDKFNLKVTFPLAGGIPIDGFIPQIDELIKILSDNKELNLHVVGHSCVIGSDHIKRVIAEVRSVYITRYLVFKGIDPSRIKTRGVADLQPILEGDTEEELAVNRRVEFIVE